MCNWIVSIFHWQQDMLDVNLGFSVRVWSVVEERRNVFTCKPAPLRVLIRVGTWLMFAELLLPHFLSITQQKEIQGIAQREATFKALNKLSHMLWENRYRMSTIALLLTLVLRIGASTKHGLPFSPIVRPMYLTFAYTLFYKEPTCRGSKNLRDFYY